MAPVLISVYRIKMAIRYAPPAPKAVLAKSDEKPAKKTRAPGGGRPPKADKLVHVTVTLPPDVLTRLQAKGPHWRSIASGLIADGVPASRD